MDGREDNKQPYICIQLLLFFLSNSSEIPWAIACQTLLFMGFPRQEYWSGLPFPSPGDLSDPEIKSTSPTLAGRFLTTEPPGCVCVCVLQKTYREKILTWEGGWQCWSRGE